MDIVIDDWLWIFIDKISCTAEIYQLQVEFGIEKDVFRLDVAVSNADVVNVEEGRHELGENKTGCLFIELVCQADHTKELPILFDLHYIVEYPLNLSITGAIYSTHIKIYDFDDMLVPGLMGHLDLIQKHLQDIVLIASLHLSLVDLLVHDFDSHPLVRR